MGRRFGQRRVTPAESGPAPVATVHVRRRRQTAGPPPAGPPRHAGDGPGRPAKERPSSRRRPLSLPAPPFNTVASRTPGPGRRRASVSEPKGCGLVPGVHVQRRRTPPEATAHTTPSGRPIACSSSGCGPPAGGRAGARGLQETAAEVHDARAREGQAEGRQTQPARTPAGLAATAGSGSGAPGGAAARVGLDREPRRGQRDAPGQPGGARGGRLRVRFARLPARPDAGAAAAAPASTGTDGEQVRAARQRQRPSRPSSSGAAPSNGSPVRSPADQAGDARACCPSMRGRCGNAPRARRAAPGPARPPRARNVDVCSVVRATATANCRVAASGTRHHSRRTSGCAGPRVVHGLAQRAQEEEADTRRRRRHQQPAQQDQGMCAAG